MLAISIKVSSCFPDQKVSSFDSESSVELTESKYKVLRVFFGV